MNTKTISVIREQEILVEVPVVLTHGESRQYALSYAMQDMNTNEWTTELGYKIYDENGEAM